MKKKQTSPPDNTATRAMIFTGVAMTLTTPFVQPLYLIIAQNQCPLVDGERLCGLDPGIQIGVMSATLPWIWFIIGAIYLTAGINSDRRSKRNS